MVIVTLGMHPYLHLFAPGKTELVKSSRTGHQNIKSDILIFLAPAYRLSTHIGARSPRVVPSRSVSTIFLTFPSPKRGPKLDFRNLRNLMKKQSTGGSIMFNISKQAINPGKNFGPYGLPKSSTLFLMKQYALECGQFDIRVNGINADRIQSGLLTKEIINQRPKARGIKESQY